MHAPGMRETKEEERTHAIAGHRLDR